MNPGCAQGPEKPSCKVKPFYLVFPLSSILSLLHNRRGVEQLAARWAHNPKVVGSSPTPANKGALSSGKEAKNKGDGAALGGVAQR